MSSSSVERLPPTPADPVERDRVEHTRGRRRQLYSQHGVDIEQLMRRKMGITRSQGIGAVDKTANPALTIYSQTAVLYNQAPTILVRDDSMPVLDLVENAGYWPLMQRVQRDTLGMREMLVRVSLDDMDGTPHFRPVFPDMVECEVLARKPSEIVILREWIESPVFGWCRDTYDLTDLTNPRRTITTESGLDVTDTVLAGTRDLEGYRYRREDGTPYIPYVVYHAATTAFLWDPYAYREVFEGALELGVLLTYFGHIVRNGAYGLRWTLNCRIAGSEVPDQEIAGGGIVPASVALAPASPRREVVTDPAIVTELESDPDAANPQAGQWSVPADPDLHGKAIAGYERRLLVLAGLQPPDVTRADSDIRSGFSLVVSREAIRDVQRVYEVQFRQADQQVLAMVATMRNVEQGDAFTTFPADYRISYQGLPLSPIEVKAQLDVLAAKQAAGLVGPVSAAMELNPLLERDEAVREVARAALEREEVDLYIRAVKVDAGALPPVQPMSDKAQLTTLDVLDRVRTGQMAATTAKIGRAHV